MPLPGAREFMEKEKKLTQTWGLDRAGVGEASEASTLEQPHLKTFLIPAKTFDFLGSEDWSHFRRREAALWSLQIQESCIIAVYAHASSMDEIPAPPPVFPAGLCRYCYS